MCTYVGTRRIAASGAWKLCDRSATYELVAIDGTTLIADLCPRHAAAAARLYPRQMVRRSTVLA